MAIVIGVRTILLSQILRENVGQKKGPYKNSFWGRNIKFKMTVINPSE
jgi:hypothetical protein